MPLVNVPPLSPFDVNVVDPFEHMACVPLNVPAFGAAVAVPEADTFTVEAAVAVQATFPLGEPADVPDAIRTYTAVDAKVPLVGEKVIELEYDPPDVAHTSNPVGAVIVTSEPK